MATITLYCREPEGLKLGPGANPGEFIPFHKGFARFEESAFPAWRTWVNHPSTPPIEILDDDSGFVSSDTPDALACPICDRHFKNDFALKGHLRSHAPKG